jgi:hypothetical protein
MIPVKKITTQKKNKLKTNPQKNLEERITQKPESGVKRKKRGKQEKNHFGIFSKKLISIFKNNNNIKSKICKFGLNRTTNLMRSALNM